MSRKFDQPVILVFYFDFQCDFSNPALSEMIILVSIDCHYIILSSTNYTMYTS